MSRSTSVALSNPLYPALIENALDLITVLDERGTITFHSPSVQRLLGYSPVELLGCCAFDFVHPDDQDRVRAEFDRAWSVSGPSPFVEYRFRHKDGSWAVLESVGRVCTTGDGTRVGIVNSRDLTSHRSLQEQMRRQQQVATLGRFTSTIVHEFRNALQVILGNLDFILESATAPPTLHPELYNIQRAGRMAEVLAQQLLEFSRDSRAAVELVDVHRTLAALATTVQHLVGREVVVSTVLRAEDDLVLARRGVLDQIVYNLASNARDAISGRGTLTITTRNARLAPPPLGRPGVVEDDTLIVEVTDSGAGMTDEVRAQVFEPFFTTKPEGTGLGLSTVRAIVEEARGRVDVRSDVGGGTTIVIAWPLACVTEHRHGH
jgi:PAS domain S-box-containing protein